MLFASTFRSAMGFAWLPLAALVLAASACGAPDDAEEDEQLGTAELSISSEGPETKVSSALANAQQPSAAWIKSASFQEGNALVGFTSGTGVGKASWAQSQGNWDAAAPTWNQARTWDDATFPWPNPPSNFCVLYSCPGNTFNGYQRVGSAVWTGLNDVAAMVTTSAAQIRNGEREATDSRDGRLGVQVRFRSSRFCT